MIRLRKYRIFLFVSLIAIAAVYYYGRDADWESSYTLDQLKGYGSRLAGQTSSSAEKDFANTAGIRPPVGDSQVKLQDEVNEPVGGEKKVADIPPWAAIPVKGGSTTTTSSSTTSSTSSSTSSTSKSSSSTSKSSTSTSSKLSTTSRQGLLALPTHTAGPAAVSPKSLEKPDATSSAFVEAGRGRLEVSDAEKQNKVHWVKPTLQYPIPSESLLQLPTGIPQRIPRIQFEFAEESTATQSDRESKLAVVKNAMTRTWSAYKKYAWLHDELRPVSASKPAQDDAQAQAQSYRDPFGGWAATLVDSLDTLWIMGMQEEFEEAVTATAGIDFTTCARPDIPIFETTIRYLGGLLGAYDISGQKYSVLLDKAVELAEVLMGAFDTPNHMPMTYYHWRPEDVFKHHEAGTGVVMAELGSLSVEFTRLAQITKQPKYYDAIARITNEFEKFQMNTMLPGMWPLFIDASSGCDASTPLTLKKVSGAVSDVVSGAVSGTGAASEAVSGAVSGTVAGAVAGAGAVSNVFSGAATGAVKGAGAVSDVVSGAVKGAVSGAGAASDAISGAVSGTVAGAAKGAGAVSDVVSGAATGAVKGAEIVSDVASGAVKGAGAVSEVVSGAVKGAAKGAGAVSDVVSGAVNGAGAVSEVVSGAVKGVASGAGAVSDVVSGAVTGVAKGAGAVSDIVSGAVNGAGAVSDAVSGAVKGATSGAGVVSDVVSGAVSKAASGAASGAGVVSEAVSGAGDSLSATAKTGSSLLDEAVHSSGPASSLPASEEIPDQRKDSSSFGSDGVDLTGDVISDAKEVYHQKDASSFGADSKAAAPDITKRQFEPTPAELFSETLATPEECVPLGFRESRNVAHGKYTLGGMADSTYEYLPKEYLLLGGFNDQYKSMYVSVIDAAREYLLYRPMVKEDVDILFTGSYTPVNYNSETNRMNGWFESSTGHLSCFVGGMFGLGAKIFDRPEDLETAIKLTDACVWSYASTASGVSPEDISPLVCDDMTSCTWNETTWLESVIEEGVKIDWTFRDALQRLEIAQGSDTNSAVGGIFDTASTADDKNAASASDRQAAGQGLPVTSSSVVSAAEIQAMPGAPALPGAVKLDDFNKHKRQFEAVEGPTSSEAFSSELDVSGDTAFSTTVEPPSAGQLGPGQISPVDSLSSAKDDALAAPSGTFTTADSEAVVDETESEAEPTTREEAIRQHIERIRLWPGIVSIEHRKYILRPEAIESVFYMYRITGDESWRSKGWTMFQAIEKSTRTDIAYSSISDATADPTYKMDEMESFWTAETLKYFYLLFSAPNVVSLDEYVLNTEAHPFLRPDAQVSEEVLFSKVEALKTLDEDYSSPHRQEFNILGADDALV